MSDKKTVNLTVGFYPLGKDAFGEKLSKELIRRFEAGEIVLAPAYIRHADGRIEITEISFVPVIDKAQ